MPSYGAGSDRYTFRTTLEYLRRVREALLFHRQCVDRLTRLERRYERLTAAKSRPASYNENSEQNQ